MAKCWWQLYRYRIPGIHRTIFQHGQCCMYRCWDTGQVNSLQCHSARRYIPVSSCTSKCLAGWHKLHHCNTRRCAVHTHPRPLHSAHLTHQHQTELTAISWHTQRNTRRCAVHTHPRPLHSAHLTHQHQTTNCIIVTLGSVQFTLVHIHFTVHTWHTSTKQNSLQYRDILNEMIHGGNHNCLDSHVSFYSIFYERTYLLTYMAEWITVRKSDVTSVLQTEK